MALVIVASALVTVWSLRRQNQELIHELEVTRQEKAALESLKKGAPQPALAPEPNKTDEMELELLRLRGAATRAARAEAENLELKRELK